MKRGCVLEGGAMRGMFSSGVIDVFMENGIVFDGLIGVSAGATFGCNYKSHQIGRAVRYNKLYMKDKRYCSFGNLWRTGDLFDTKFCYDDLPNVLDKFDYETFKADPSKFYVVATDVDSGEAVAHEMSDCGEVDMKWMRASASMPLCANVVEVDGRRLLDGGMADSIPLQMFEKMGYDRNVVILTQPRDFVKKPNKLFWLMKLLLGKYKGLIKAMKNRHNMYNDETKYVFEKADRGEVMVICPEKPLGIGRLEKNPDELERCYQEGRKAAIAKLDEVKRFLQ